MAQSVWGKHPYGRKSQFQPFVYDVKAKAWDLDKKNDYYFPIMRKIVARNQESNKTTIFDVFDGCELHAGGIGYSPWAVNKQGVSSFYDQKADKFTRDFFETCISELKGYDIIWGTNEPENQGYPGMFERVILPVAKAKKIPWTRLTYGATTKPEKANSIQDQVRAIIRSKYGRFAQKSILSPDHGFPFTKNGLLNLVDAKILSDDGFYLGDSKCDVRPGKGARPSAATWGRVSLAILKTSPVADGARWPILFFEHLPAGFSIGDLLCWLAPIMAISASYRARFGVWPSNYGKRS